MIPARAWILLSSGRRLDLLNPDPEAFIDRDLAIGLSRTYRWAGASAWDLPLSVAQHSLTVLVMRQKMQALLPLTPVEALRELLHDAEEGLLGFDPISPLKPHLGPDFRAVTDRLRAAIDRRYALPPWGGADRILHKRADHLAAASEAFHVAGWSREDIRDSLGITLAPVADDPLPTPDGMQPWEPWPPKLATALFLGKLRELTRSNADAPGQLNAVVYRERMISTLAARFSQLPLSRRRRCCTRLTGSSLSDTHVYAEAHDGSQNAEGIIVDGQRDKEGRWELDAPFTIFTTDEELIVCDGANCDVDVQ